MISKTSKTREEIIYQYKRLEESLRFPDHYRSLLEETKRPIQKSNYSHHSSIQKIKRKYPLIFLK